MSVTASYQINCDGQGDACFEFVMSLTSLSDARRQAMAEGWMVGRSSKPDLCPNCREHSPPRRTVEIATR